MTHRSCIPGPQAARWFLDSPKALVFHVAHRFDRDIERCRPSSLLTDNSICSQFPTRLTLASCHAIIRGGGSDEEASWIPQDFPSMQSYNRQCWWTPQLHTIYSSRRNCDGTMSKLYLSFSDGKRQTQKDYELSLEAWHSRQVVSWWLTLGGKCYWSNSVISVAQMIRVDSAS